MRRPRILILDDTTSALDVATEARVQDAIRELMGDSTVFLVAQRISAVLTADVIVVLEEGRIVAKGSHKELLASSPEYRSIYESQLGPVPADGRRDPQPGHRDRSRPKPLRRLLGYLLRRRAAGSPSTLAAQLRRHARSRSSRPCRSAGSSTARSATATRRSSRSTCWSCLLFAAGGFLGMWLGGRVLAVAAQDAMYRLRKDVFEHTQTLSLRFFDRQPIGDLMSRITNDLDSVGQLFDKGLYPAINSAFTLVITTVLMFIVCWQLSIAVVLIAPLILVLMQFTSRYSGPAFAVLQERTGALNGAAEELITGDRTVKAYLVEDAGGGEARGAQRRGARGRRPRQLRRAHRHAAVGDAVEPRRRPRRPRRRLAVAARARSASARSRSFFIFARMFARPLNQFAQILNMALQAARRRHPRLRDPRRAARDRRPARTRATSPRSTGTS